MFRMGLGGRIRVWSPGWPGTKKEEAPALRYGRRGHREDEDGVYLACHPRLAQAAEPLFRRHAAISHPLSSAVDQTASPQYRRTGKFPVRRFRFSPEGQRLRK